jgi:hypothetical protein
LGLYIRGEVVQESLISFPLGGRRALTLGYDNSFAPVVFRIAVHLSWSHGMWSADWRLCAWVHDSGAFSLQHLGKLHYQGEFQTYAKVEGSVCESPQPISVSIQVIAILEDVMWIVL